ncbi:MAG: hypothetical protein AAF485_08780 [Chloroflexota bacterium]
MFNPPNSNNYDDLLNKIAQRAKARHLDDQIVELLQQMFDDELRNQNIILSRSDRARLFRDVANGVVDDVLEAINDTK